MSVDEVVVLRAAGLEAAAKVVEAARAGQVAAQPPAAPAAPAEPTPGQLQAAEQEAAAQAAAQLPEGIMSAEEIAAYEAAGGTKGLSYREAAAANERFCSSVDYHGGVR
jgi:hypothetical protein